MLLHALNMGVLIIVVLVESKSSFPLRGKKKKEIDQTKQESQKTDVQFEILSLKRIGVWNTEFN